MNKNNMNKFSSNNIKVVIIKYNYLYLIIILSIINYLIYYKLDNSLYQLSNINSNDYYYLLIFLL